MTRRLILGLTTCCTILMAQTAMADITYVDATSGAVGNTTLANGTAFTPPLNGVTGADNLWEERTPLGSSGNIFEGGGEVAENAPELRTTISGLTPGMTYSLYAYFWDPTSTAEDWNLRAGLASNAGANTVYAAADATGDLVGSTAAGLASAQTFTVGAAPTINAEGGRALLAASLGTAIAAGDGTLAVFIDDLPSTIGANNRTWYDGVGFELSAIPEPSSLLITLGLAGGLAVRRRRK